MTDKRTKKDKNNIDVNDLQMVEAAEKKLRWYILEASEEEFDEAEVDFLVGIIDKYTPKSVAEPQSIELDMERFQAYYALWDEDEKQRNTVKNVQKPDKARKERPVKSGWKRWAVLGAAACVLLLIIVGGSLGDVNAGEDSGFFHWLKKDKEGILAITSPEGNEIEMNMKKENVYRDVNQVPEEYKGYMVNREEFSNLEHYEFDCLTYLEAETMQKISQQFVCESEEKVVQIGFIMYEEKQVITREIYENYKFLYTNAIGEIQQDVFVKEEKNGELEYVVLFYDENRKYFVEGNQDVKFLEMLSEEYLDWVMNGK